MRLLISILILLLSFEVNAQISSEDSTAIEFDGEILEIGGCEPEYSGGNVAILKFLNDTIKYPPLAQELGVSGIVYVQFVVNKDGSIEQVEAIHGPHELLECAAEDAIKAMPNWIPAICRGEAVRVRYTLPITFSLH
jgi:TonB family protein